jgi:hypothetical protein
MGKIPSLAVEVLHSQGGLRTMINMIAITFVQLLEDHRTGCINCITTFECTKHLVYGSLNIY